MIEISELSYWDTLVVERTEFVGPVEMLRVGVTVVLRDLLKTEFEGI